MGRKRAEKEAAERLLAGDPSVAHVAPYALLASALETLRTPAPVDAARANETIAAMSQIAAEDAPARRVRFPRPRIVALGPRLAAAGLAAALSAGTGLAFTGSLPGPAQDTVHDVLSRVGVNVPRAHTPSPHPSNKGAEISDDAHNTSTEGGKGAEVSNDASDGRSRAGEDHGNSQEGQNQGDEHKPSATPSASPSARPTGVPGEDGRSTGSDSSDGHGGGETPDPH